VRARISFGGIVAPPLELPWSERTAWEFSPDPEPLVAPPFDNERVTAAGPWASLGGNNCEFFAERRPPLEDLASFLAYTTVVMLLVRARYYASWKLAEGAAVLCGFGLRSEAVVRASRASRDAATPTAFSDALWLLRSVLGLSPTGLVRALACGCGSAASLSRLARALAVFGLGLPESSADLEGGGAAAARGTTGGSDGESVVVPDWEGVSNVNPLSVETGTSMQQLFAEWNVLVQRWLRDFVFLRLPRSVNRQATMLVSAAWHGFFPGYYMAFGSVPFITETTRVFMQGCGAVAERLFGWSVRPPPARGGDGCAFPLGRAWLPLRLAWCALRWAVTFLCFTYVLAPFLSLQWARSLAVWEYLAFAGHVVPAVLGLAGAALLRFAARRSSS
jgi:hypothetical protein